jgi:gamma-glutamyltranspeptidase/glutathione hydrolase
MRNTARTLLFVITLAMPLYSQSPAEPLDRSHARSRTITRGGIVATSQTLASQAGAQILERGGSAVDAAIAANAVLGVVEPMMNGMGGDLFVMYWDAKTGKLTGLNSSGWAPEKLTPEFLNQKGYAKMPEAGIFSITVPGCVRGWEALHKKFGRLPWTELFQPAIYYAQNGFPVSEWISQQWKTYQPNIMTHANGRRAFLLNGELPKVGQVFRNPEYARALESISSEGADAFYRGEIARAILKTSDRQGGVLTASDLADFEPEWVEPISTTYRDWTVYELPPNGQGLAALEMLNIFEQFPMPQWGFLDARAFHVKMEAQKLAYADLRRYDADPRFVLVPTPGIISKPYGADRAATIDMNHTHCDVTPGDPARFMGDTIYMSACDKDGNIVSLIQSLYQAFGSGIVVDDFGITLQNRGALFVLDRANPDVLAPHKRPFHRSFRLSCNAEASTSASGLWAG